MEYATARRAEFDWLRLVALGLMMLFHGAIGYSSWQWHVSDSHRSVALGNVQVALLARFGNLPLADFFWVFAGLMAVVALVLAPLAAAADEPVRGGTLEFAVVGTPPTLNSAKQHFELGEALGLVQSGPAGVEEYF